MCESVMILLPKENDVWKWNSSMYQNKIFKLNDVWTCVEVMFIKESFVVKLCMKMQWRYVPKEICQVQCLKMWRFYLPKKAVTYNDVWKCDGFMY